MDMYNQYKNVDEIVANTIATMYKLWDYDLTIEEKFDITDITERLINIASRFRKEMKSECESIM